MKKTMRTANNLRMRISERGDLLASVSKSSGEFCMNLEIVQMLRMLDKFNGDSKKFSGELKRAFDATTKNLPGAEDVEGLMAELNDAGVIVTDGADDGGIQDGFGDPWIQWAMISDSARTQAYLKALDKVVDKNAVVLDSGAGTGVFSAFALMKGAKHVYAVEETATASEIPKILRKMNIQHEGRFTLIRSHSSDAKFPRNVNVVVSELFGNDPLGEGMVPTLASVLSRIEKNGLRVIPGACEVFVEIVDIKKGAALHRMKAFSAPQQPKNSGFYEKFIEAAKNSLDFSSLSFSIFLREDEFSASSKPTSLGKFSLLKFSEEPVLVGKRKLNAIENADVPAILMWFKATLIDGVSVSSRVGLADFAEHWSPIVIPLNSRVVAGDILEVDFAVSEDSTQILLDVCRNGKRLGAR